VKGLDTNVIVAWLLDSSGKDTLPIGERFWVSLVAVAELVWVFDSVYRRSKAETADIVAKLLAAGNIEFESEEVVKRSLEDFRNGSADFADYLLMNDGLSSGCTTTLTYDQKAGRHPGFTLLKKSR
jgi:predicted nucleic-acid-binding protein